MQPMSSQQEVRYAMVSRCHRVIVGALSSAYNAVVTIRLGALG